MPMSEAKRKEREKEKLEEEKELLQAFREWVGSINEKTYDLTKPKSEIRDKFIERVVGNKYKSLTNFSMAVLKSFMKYKEEDVLPFVNTNDYKIKKSVGMINKFFNDYVLDDNSADCKNSDDVCKLFSKIVLDEMEETYGAVAYLDIMKDKTMDRLKPYLTEEIKNRGYVSCPKDPRFLIKTTQYNGHVVTDRQSTILKNYEKIVNKYIVDWAPHITENTTDSQYFEFWETVKICLLGMELCMTPETKKSETFIKNKEIIDDFYVNKIDKIRRSKTNDGKRGNYYNLVNGSLDRCINKTNSLEDTEILKRFYHKLENLKEALSYKDENGDSYPVNYFVCMSIHPSTIMSILTKMQRSDLFTKDQVKFLTTVKSEIRKQIPSTNLRNDGDVEKTESVLYGYRLNAVFIDGRKTDLRTDKAYNDFIKKVDEYIDDNNLPRYGVCISLVADAMRNGRSPIKMPQLNSPEKDK